jgi:uncharacterized membrane protein
MSWRTRFRARQFTKNSLWLVPLLAGLGGIVLAEVAHALDMRTDLAVLQYSPETATAVVSASIAAVVSLTGFVVTVTVLGVQQATGIFSPRYMRLWYRDRRLKLVLAELVGTLMFSISVIRRIQPDAVPDISVSMAGLGVSVGLLLFLLYFGQFLHRMRPVAVADLLAREGRRAFEAWMERAVRPDIARVTGGWAPTTDPAFVLRTDRSGTIQAIDTRGLTAFAQQHRCLIVFRHAVGDFVPVGAPILAIHGATLPVAASRRLSGMVALGVERTIEQDPAFAIRVMVDIAIRALSPAVNDPTTAVQVLDYLEDTLRVVGSATGAAGATGGASRDTLSSGLIMPVRTWADFLALGVTEIRDYGASSFQMTRRLRALLEELDALVLPENRAAVGEELRRLDATVRAARADSIDLDLALAPDRQGIGGPATAHEALGDGTTR